EDKEAGGAGEESEEKVDHRCGSTRRPRSTQASRRRGSAARAGRSGRPRNRTGTGFTPVDFESTASASSARRPRARLVSTAPRRGKIGAGAGVELRGQPDALAE